MARRRCLEPYWILPGWPVASAGTRLHFVLFVWVGFKRPTEKANVASREQPELPFPVFFSNRICVTCKFSFVSWAWVHNSKSNIFKDGRIFKDLQKKPSGPSSLAFCPDAPGKPPTQGTKARTLTYRLTPLHPAPDTLRCTASVARCSFSTFCGKSEELWSTSSSILFHIAAAAAAISLIFRGVKCLSTGWFSLAVIANSHR